MCISYHTEMINTTQEKQSDINNPPHIIKYTYTNIMPGVFYPITFSI